MQNIEKTCTELWTQNSEHRTQTFIYLTNNVYNYIQIVKKYLINQVRRQQPLRQKVCLDARAQ